MPGVDDADNSKEAQQYTGGQRQFHWHSIPSFNLRISLRKLSLSASSTSTISLILAFAFPCSAEKPTFSIISGQNSFSPAGFSICDLGDEKMGDHRPARGLG